MTAVVTAYCACAICCGPHHHAQQRTASGTRPLAGRTVAAPRNVPFGTKILIKGLRGQFTVEDRTADRFDGRWDIYFADHNTARRFGRRQMNIRILK